MQDGPLCGPGYRLLYFQLTELTDSWIGAETSIKKKAEVCLPPIEACFFFWFTTEQIMILHIRDILKPLVPMIPSPLSI